MTRAAVATATVNVVKEHLRIGRVMDRQLIWRCDNDVKRIIKANFFKETLSVRGEFFYC
jgi:hypothetical protein